MEIESRQGFRGGLGREADREKWPSFSFSTSSSSYLSCLKSSSFSTSFSLSCQLSSSSSFSTSSPSSCLPSSSSSPCWSGGSPELAPGKALCRLPRTARRRSWGRCSLHWDQRGLHHYHDGQRSKQNRNQITPSKVRDFTSSNGWLSRVAMCKWIFLHIQF